MNLHSYFTQQHDQKLSDEKKLFLYQRICDQRAWVPHSLKRSAILTKKRVYAFLAFALFFAFFGTFFRENTEVSEYRAFFAQRNFLGFGSVSAAQVGEVLEINGEYLIEKEGKQFKNSVLFDGDLIILKDNAKIIFNINEHIKAEVQGPARFIISKIADGNYCLSLIEGNYLKLDWEKDTDALQVETEEMSIAMSKNEEIDFEMKRANKRTQLSNAGAPLLVRNKKLKTEKATTLETAKFLTVQDNDIAEIKDIDHFEKVLVTKKNFTHTTKLSQTSTGEPSSLALLEKEFQHLSKEVNFVDDKQDVASSWIQKAINTELSYQSDQRQVPTEKQLSQITAALNKRFLLSDIEAFYTAKLEKNEEALQGVYTSIAWRIKSIWDSYDIAIKIVTTPKELIRELESLQKGLDAYHLPPQKLHQLEVIHNWLLHMQDFVPTESRELYEQHLPDPLHFN